MSALRAPMQAVVRHTWRRVVRHLTLLVRREGDWSGQIGSWFTPSITLAGVLRLRLLRG